MNAYQQAMLAQKASQVKPAVRIYPTWDLNSKVKLPNGQKIHQLPDGVHYFIAGRGLLAEGESYFQNTPLNQELPLPQIESFTQSEMYMSVGGENKMVRWHTQTNCPDVLDLWARSAKTKKSQDLVKYQKISGFKAQGNVNDVKTKYLLPVMKVELPVDKKGNVTTTGFNPTYNSDKTGMFFVSGFVFDKILKACEDADEYVKNRPLQGALIELTINRAAAKPDDKYVVKIKNVDNFNNDEFVLRCNEITNQESKVLEANFNQVFPTFESFNTTETVKKYLEMLTGESFAKLTAKYSIRKNILTSETDDVYNMSGDDDVTTDDESAPF